MAFASNEFLYNDYAGGDELGPDDIGEDGASYPSHVIWTAEVQELKRHLFPTPDVMSDTDKQYYNTKQELYDSERQYLKFLLTVQRFFMDTLEDLRIADKNCNIKKYHLRQMFAELPTIYNINKELLREMRMNEAVEVPFKKMCPFLKTYATYARNYPNVIKTFNELSATSSAFNGLVCKNQSKSPCQGNTLMALMIMPIQRIPRYIMLLSKMRVTTPFDEESDALSGVVKELEEIAGLTESCIRDYENQQDLYRIQRSLELTPPIVAPGRRFLKEGFLFKISRTSDTHDERMFWLFNDILVYGKRRLMSINPKYSCSVSMPLKHCRLVYSEVAGSLQITCKDQSVLVTSDSYDNLKEWYEQINTAVNRVNILRSTLRKESSRQHVRNFKNRLVKKFTNKFMKKTYDVTDCLDLDQSQSVASYSDSEMQPSLRRSQRKRKADSDFDEELRDALRRRRVRNGEESADESESEAQFADPNSFIPPKEYIAGMRAPVKKRVRSSESASSSKTPLSKIVQPAISRQSSVTSDEFVTKRESRRIKGTSEYFMTKAESRKLQGIDEPDRAPRTRSQVRRVLADAQRVSTTLSHPEIRHYSYQEANAPPVEPPSLDSSFEVDPQRSQFARDKAVPWYVTEAAPALYSQKQKKSGLIDAVRNQCSIM